MSERKILVTGSAGFIGAATCKQLLDMGEQVVGIDNINWYYDIRLKNHRLSLLNQYENFEFYNIDIENYSVLLQLFEQHNIESIINLAARAGVRYSIENPHIYMSTNGQGTLNLLEAMRKHNINKMVLASSSSLYAGQEMPFQEKLAVNTPLSPYAASKKAAEVMTYSYHTLFDLDISILRYFTVYGPAGRPDMSILRFIKWIDTERPITLYGNGTQSRDFTYVEDIARGTILSLKSLGYEIINLGGGKNPIAINKIIEILENLLQKKAVIDQHPFHKADMLSTWADIDKAKKLLDWKPTVSIEEGLKKTVDWYFENKNLVLKLDF